jgi:hypothetical protein
MQDGQIKPLRKYVLLPLAHRSALGHVQKAQANIVTPLDYEAEKEIAALYADAIEAEAEKEAREFTLYGSPLAHEKMVFPCQADYRTHGDVFCFIKDYATYENEVDVIIMPPDWYDDPNLRVVHGMAYRFGHTVLYKNHWSVHDTARFITSTDVYNRLTA